MGAHLAKQKDPQMVVKFVGTNAQFAELQKDLSALYKQVKGQNLAEGRLKTEQSVLDVLITLEVQVFGVAQQGQNLIDRLDRLSHKVNSV